MASPIRDFFAELDAQWSWPVARPIRLSVIGCGALLLLEPRYDRGTKDGDVLETLALTPETVARLTTIAGHGTRLHAQRGIYLDIVKNGIPFLPHAPTWVPLDSLNAGLRSFEVVALTVVDVVVSKLKRFHADDQTDIQAMVDQGYVPREHLAERFRSAVDAFSCDARADDLPRYVANLHRVERDMMGIDEGDETEIELPSWI